MAVTLNGGTKVTLAVVSSFIVGAITMALYVGAARERMDNHIENKTLHEQEIEKRMRIAEMMSSAQAPLMVEIKRLKEQLDRMEKRMDQ